MDDAPPEIVSGGSGYSYFGHDEWSAHALEVKSLERARERDPCNARRRKRV